MKFYIKKSKISKILCYCSHLRLIFVKGRTRVISPACRALNMLFFKPQKIISHNIISWVSRLFEKLLADIAAVSVFIFTHKIFPLANLILCKSVKFMQIIITENERVCRKQKLFLLTTNLCWKIPSQAEPNCRLSNLF